MFYALIFIGIVDRSRLVLVVIACTQRNNGRNIVLKAKYRWEFEPLRVFRRNASNSFQTCIDTTFELSSSFWYLDRVLRDVVGTSFDI